MKINKPNILFKNVTTYTSKNYNQFLKFHNDKYEFSYNFYTIIMSIILGYCAIMNIKQKNISLIFLFTFLFIGFIALRLYLPVRRLKKTKENIKKVSNSTHTFLFYDYYLKVGKQTIYYFKLYKIFESKDYFYLYINQDYALMLDKKGFQIGTVEDFRSFIKRKCLFKYKEIS